MIIIFDHGLFKQKRTTLENRVRKTAEAFSELSKKLNVYKLKTQEAIEKAWHAILKKYHTTDLFLFKIALQVIVPIERNARKNIKDRDRGIDNFPTEKMFAIRELKTC